MALRLLFLIAGTPFSILYFNLRLNISVPGCCSLPLPPTTLVDLTHDVSASSITWPSNQPFAVTQVWGWSHSIAVMKR